MRMLGLVLLFGTASFNVMGFEKTICGRFDDRTPSFDKKIGRLRQMSAGAGCTVTLIGKSCAITAGHCHSTFEIAEFNTLASRNGRILPSAKEDTYFVDKSSVVYENGGRGKD